MSIRPHPALPTKLQKIPENVSNNREDYLPNPLVAFCRSYLELIWYDHRITG